MILRLVIFLLTAALGSAANIVVNGPTGSPLTSLSLSQRYGGPANAWVGMYFVSGNSATASISVLANGDDLQFHKFVGTATCSTFPGACSSVTYGATIGVASYSATLSVGTHNYTIRITDSGAGNSPLDIPFTYTVVAARANPAPTTTVSLTGCSNSEAAYPGADSCTDSTWRPDSTAFSIPSVGSTYVDPTFGSTVAVVAGPAGNHDYSTMSPYNFDNSKLVLTINGVRSIVNAITGAVVVSNVSCNFWSTTTANICYGVTSNIVKKYTYDYGMGTESTSNLVDLSSEVTTDLFSTGGTGDSVAIGSGWLPVLSITGTSSTDYKVCMVRLSDGYKTCTTYNPGTIGGVAYTFIDFVVASKGRDTTSSKAYVIVAANPSSAFFSLDTNQASPTLTFEYRGPKYYSINPNGNPALDYPGSLDYATDYQCATDKPCLGAFHMDTYQDSAGNQYLVSELDFEAASPVARYLFSMLIRSGEAAILKPAELGGGMQFLATVSTYASGEILEAHLGCAKAGPWCGFSLNQIAATPITGCPTITAATNAMPIAITCSTAHGWSTGKKVNIGSALGNTAANGVRTIVNTGSNTFTLDSTTGNGTYTSGGVACDGDPYSTKPYRAEQWVFNQDTIWRVARSRTSPCSGDVGSGYWVFPRGALSPDASRMIFDGNYGVPGATYVSAAVTGITAPTSGPASRVTGAARLSGTARR